MEKNERIEEQVTEQVKKKNKKRKKGVGKKIAISFLCCFLVLLIVLYAMFTSYWNKITTAPPQVIDTMTYDFDTDIYETIPTSLVDDPVFEQIHEGDASEFKAAIKEWATNDADIMYSKDVINVLCVGVDTRNKNTVSGLTDSMIICSVNTKLGTITFSSIMRDSYAYLESPSGEGVYNKINSAFPFYGIDNLIDTVESHFKIRIDGYAMVNFALFKAVIDKFNGIEVAVDETIASHLRNSYGFDVYAGPSVTLSGDQALAYCRSRKCYFDGDVSRTANQRRVLAGLLHKAATIQPSEVKSYVELIMPYLETSYSETEVLSLATKAVVGGWAEYKVNQICLPDEQSRKAYSGSVWYWKVDYPLAAQTLQKTIYGNTNIELEEDRISPLDM